MNNNSLLTPEISQLSPFFSKEGNSEKINEDKKDIKNQFSMIDIAIVLQLRKIKLQMEKKLITKIIMAIINILMI